ncbi:MAG: sulfate transporter CysZ [Pseudomonadota bacterium]|nr:sulfate transporter CysZ [Pseudomonadota bacterium]
MIVQFTRGAGYVARGFALINQPGIRRYVAMPLLINFLLFGGAIWFGAAQFEGLLDWLLPNWLEWARWLLWPLFAATALLVVFYAFTLIANLIGAPFNGLLAEKLEAHLTDVPLPEAQSLGYLLRTGAKAIVNELRKLAYVLLRAVPLLILFLIPGLNVIAPFVWLAFTAWMLALEYIDAPMGNHELTFHAGKRVLRANRALALGFGGAVLLMTSIPILNFFAMPVAVAGATAMWVERLKTFPSRITSRSRTKHIDRS